MHPTRYPKIVVVGADLSARQKSATKRRRSLDRERQGIARASPLAIGKVTKGAI